MFEIEFNQYYHIDTYIAITFHTYTNKIPIWIEMISLYWYQNMNNSSLYSIGRYFFEDLLRYPLAREGVYAPGGPDFLAHAMQRVNYIVGLTALRLAFFMGYE